jgi:phosphatidylserine/phosphatidylglycerophosphate/cardiolipin synthase-like enzyme
MTSQAAQSPPASGGDEHDGVYPFAGTGLPPRAPTVPAPRAPERESPAARPGPDQPAGWFLGAEERGNPDTDIDGRHSDGLAWTSGNEVTPLIHGRAYFAALHEAVSATRSGDLVLFTDWRGDPDEVVDDDGTAVSSLMCHAAERGVTVKGLVWRSHLDLLRFSSRENRRLGAEIEAAGGECLLDMRVRTGGSHHQKMVVVRYRDRPDRDVAFVGGIDLCHSRRDDEQHHGDPLSAPMPPVYGDRPAWHDIQLAIRGPAVGDCEATFRERWRDPAPLSHNPLRLARGHLDHEDLRADRLPAQPEDPGACGTQLVQVLRTYPHRRWSYPFARSGERSIARAYAKAVAQARSIIYIEDQYLWSTEVAQVFATALRREPQLRMVAVIPLHPDTDGNAARSEALGRARALALLRAAGGGRVAVYGIENHAGRPVYVHAKACVIDDVWSCIGSDNLNLRSWTHDSEFSCAVMDADAGPGFGQALRLRLAREHLDRADGDDRDLRDPRAMFEEYRRCAAALDAWHDFPGTTTRPAGRLRAYRLPRIGRVSRILATPMYRYLCDPDGRPAAMRRRHVF